MNEIDRLIALVAKYFTFDAKAYPELAGKDEKQTLAFALRHSALHFSKTAGKIAAVSEDIDHGEEIEIDKIRKNTVKALMNTLRLAELVGLSGQDLVQSVEENVQEKD